MALYIANVAGVAPNLSQWYFNFHKLLEGEQLKNITDWLMRAAPAMVDDNRGVIELKIGLQTTGHQFLSHPRQRRSTGINLSAHQSDLTQRAVFCRWTSAKTAVDAFCAAVTGRTWEEASAPPYLAGL